jgi:hypothetical protein
MRVPWSYYKPIPSGTDGERRSGLRRTAAQLPKRDLADDLSGVLCALALGSPNLHILVRFRLPAHEGSITRLVAFSSSSFGDIYGDHS